MVRPILKWIATFLVFLVCADFVFAIFDDQRLLKKSGSPDSVNALSKRIVRGMDRDVVEEEIAGFKSTEILMTDDQSRYRYSYWNGFLPPLGVLFYKKSRVISVTYTSTGRVMQSRCYSL